MNVYSDICLITLLFNTPFNDILRQDMPNKPTENHTPQDQKPKKLSRTCSVLLSLLHVSLPGPLMNNARENLLLWQRTSSNLGSKGAVAWRELTRSNMGRPRQEG